MFSGIVEEFATVTELVKEQENLHYANMLFCRRT